MKTLARIGAVLSFAFFLLAGTVLLLIGAQAVATDGSIAIMLGLCLVGIAFFAGTLLWLAGEKCCSRQDNS